MAFPTDAQTFSREYGCTEAEWLQALNPEWGFLRVFQYITFRAVMAAMTALLIGLAFGPWVIRRLTEIAPLDGGVITMIGTAHIEFLGSRENIAEGGPDDIRNNERVVEAYRGSAEKLVPQLHEAMARGDLAGGPHPDLPRRARHHPVQHRPGRPPRGT